MRRYAPSPGSIIERKLERFGGGSRNGDTRNQRPGRRCAQETCDQKRRASRFRSEREVGAIGDGRLRRSLRGRLDARGRRRSRGLGRLGILGGGHCRNGEEHGQRGAGPGAPFAMGLSLTDMQRGLPPVLRTLF